MFLEYKLREKSKGGMWGIITINQPIDYMARGYMILMRGVDIRYLPQVMSTPRKKNHKAQCHIEKKVDW